MGGKGKRPRELCWIGLTLQEEGGGRGGQLAGE